MNVRARRRLPASSPLFRTPPPSLAATCAAVPLQRPGAVLDARRQIVDRKYIDIKLPYADLGACALLTSAAPRACLWVQTAQLSPPLRAC